MESDLPKHITNQSIARPACLINLEIYPQLSCVTRGKWHLSYRFYNNYGGWCGLSRRFYRSPFSQKHKLRRVAYFLRWLIKPIRERNDVCNLGRHGQCLAMVGFVQHVGLCGFPEAIIIIQ